MEITAPPGTLIGSIKQNWSFSPSFDIKNESGTTVLKIEGELFGEKYFNEMNIQTKKL
jgi:uncharacterized protein YxjI